MTLDRRSMPRRITRATFSAEATSGFGSGSPCVIGVATKPGLIVSTCTPDLNKRARNPAQYALKAALAAPYKGGDGHLRCPATDDITAAVPRRCPSIRGP